MLNCVFGFTNTHEEKKKWEKGLQWERKSRHPKNINEIFVVNHHNKSK